MRARSLFSLLPLGAALAGAASAVQAQPVSRIIVCRDGAQVASRSARACSGHRGVDVRATDLARRGGTGPYNDGAYNNGAYGNGTYNSGGYRNDADAYRNHGQAVAAQRHAENEARREARRRDDDRRPDDRRSDDRRHDDRRPDDHRPY